MRHPTPLAIARSASILLSAGLIIPLGRSEIAAQEAVVADLDLQGGRVHYEVAGRGPPVVFVHGGVMDLRMWDPQMAEFTRQHTVIRFDLRGYGKSPAPARAFTPADDLAALLDHLGIQKAAVVGASMGGAVAVDFALAYPERVDRLVLAEPGLSGHQFSPEVMASMQRVSAALMQNDIEGAVEAFLASPAIRYARDHPSAIERVETMVRENMRGLISGQYMRLKEARQVERLGDVRIPTLVLVSEYAGQDGVEITDRVASEVPGASRITVEDSGHLMNLENSRRFNEVVLAFLRRRE